MRQSPGGVWGGARAVPGQMRLRRDLGEQTSVRETCKALAVVCVIEPPLSLGKLPEILLCAQLPLGEQVYLGAS